MKVGLCCIGRRENLYVNEYVNHYLSLGVDKIFIYDNNYDGEEHFEDVLSEYISAGSVEIVDFRNKQRCHMESYQDCWDKNNKDFDWMLFVDCGDEYLYMNDFNNIKDFLKQDKFTNYDLIHISIMTYGDNDLVRYEDKPLKERFTEPILPLNFKKNLPIPENNHVSSIVRCGIDNVVWNCTPHTPNGDIKCCDASGNPCNSRSPFMDFDFSVAHFKHYTSKTLEEWLNVKVPRGFADGNLDYFKKNDPIKEFFKVNKVTKEKIDYLIEKGYIDSSYEQLLLNK